MGGRLLPWLLPPATLCVCGKPLRERKRKPCPRCGSLNRIISRSAWDGFTSADHT